MSIQKNGKMFVDVVDYKVTSVWSLLLGEKPEWEKQLNTYAWLIEKNKNATVRASRFAPYCEIGHVAKQSKTQAIRKPLSKWWM